MTPQMLLLFYKTKNEFLISSNQTTTIYLYSYKCNACFFFENVTKLDVFLPFCTYINSIMEKTVYVTGLLSAYKFFRFFLDSVVLNLPAL
jgi:hypothetical protein